MLLKYFSDSPAQRQGAKGLEPLDKARPALDAVAEPDPRDQFGAHRLPAALEPGPALD